MEATKGAQSSTSGKGKTILVTGGSGFVAAHVLNSFLSRGYNVRTTVRSEQTAGKVKNSHSKYADQLSFAVVEDIATPGAHDEAVKGVDGVIHTASPFILQVEDNERDLLIPAIAGTTGLLKSIQQHNPTVKRVVITSSFAAIIDISKGAWPEHTYTEADWNPVTYDEAASPSTPGTVAYCASKKLAEQAAHAYVAEHAPNFTVTSICPPMVYGPAAHAIASLSNLNTSSADVYRLINGSEHAVPTNSFFAFVDVRDLGEAHARAFENPVAAGQRYFCCAGEIFTYQRICDIIRREFPEKRHLVPEGKPGAPLPETYKVDNRKCREELGLEFRSLETCIQDQVAEFIEIEKGGSR